jgi:hypothetical protein
MAKPARVDRLDGISGPPREVVGPVPLIPGTDDRTARRTRATNGTTVPIYGARVQAVGELAGVEQRESVPLVHGRIRTVEDRAVAPAVRGVGVYVVASLRGHCCIFRSSVVIVGAEVLGAHRTETRTPPGGGAR